MPYAKTVSHNGKDGWITETASGKGTFDNPVKIPNDIEPKDPKREKEAPRWNGEKVVIEKTGTLIRPSPSEAKDRLLKKAKTDWGMNRGQVRALIKKYAIYEFIDGGNYDEAKLEVDDALNAGDITQQQNDWIYDMLDGKT